MTMINKKELQRDLWHTKVEQFAFIKESDRNWFLEFGLKYEGQISGLYRLYETFAHKEKYMEDEEHGITFERDGECYYLSSDGKEIEFSYQELKQVLVSAIDIFEEVLPLGSVVDLKKKYFTQKMAEEDIEHVRVMITNRFMSKEGAEIYFPYAGVIYPLGMVKENDVIQFSSALIEKVQHRGFTNEEDDAYVMLMKEALLTERNMHSAGFAAREAIEALRK